MIQDPEKKGQDLGVSERALKIAKMIDRLPPGGSYILIVEKPAIEAALWTYDIVRTDRVFHGTLVKKV